MGYLNGGERHEKTFTSLRINKLGNAKQSVKHSHSSRYPENTLGTSFYKIE